MKVERTGVLHSGVQTCVELTARKRLLARHSPACRTLAPGVKVLLARVHLA
jgi:hypothetical protein